MGYQIAASIMPCNQIMMDELIRINAVGCLVRDNHWMVIGCHMSEIALLCGCGKLAGHFYTCTNCIGTRIELSFIVRRVTFVFIIVGMFWLRKVKCQNFFTTNCTVYHLSLEYLL